MGHLVGKDIYLELGNKIDGLPFRISKNKELFAILKTHYKSEEAELVIKMPYYHDAHRRKPYGQVKDTLWVVELN